MSNPFPQTSVERPAHLKSFIALLATVLGGWILWATVLLPLLPPEFARSSFTGIAARLFFWILPGALYLRRIYNTAWLSPLWLRLQPGRLHLSAIVLGTLVVSLLLTVGTARQKGVPPLVLLDALATQARLALRTPILEELLFRGVIVGEACRLAVMEAQGALSLRLRYWGAQFGAALFFTFIHWPYWVSHYGLEFSLASSGPLMVTALVLGVVFVHTRSLWPCIFLHWLNNQLSTLDLG